MIWRHFKHGMKFCRHLNLPARHNKYFGFYEISEDRSTNLLLPRYGDSTGTELPIEIDVLRLNLDSLNRGELLNIKNILGVNSVGLKSKKRKPMIDREHQ